MATASIRSWVNIPTPTKPAVTDASRDDLAINDEVQLSSVNVGTAYQWSIAFKPEGSSAVFSSTGTEQAVAKDPGFFTVDKDGPYLIRLAFTDGTGTSEQYVRLRAETAFGDLKLVAAGERYDTLRIPVDATASGWADEQNFNLNALLGLVKTSTVSGRVLYVDPLTGDFATIQEAIDEAAGLTPTASEQWVVLVRPNTYTEDLTFAPYVNVFGWPGGRDTGIVEVRNATNAGHTITLAGVGETLALANIHFQQPVTSPNAAFSQTGAGSVRVFRCTLEAQGNTGEVWSSQGPTHFTQCTVNGNGVAVTDYALRTTDLLVLDHSFVSGKSCVILEEGSVLWAKDTRFTPTGTYAINTRASSTSLQWCHVDGLIAGNPTGAGMGGDLIVSCNWSEAKDITIDGAGVVGAARVELGSSTHDAVTPINGATVVATVPSDTNFYDSTATGLTAANVQDALDEIHAYAAMVRTLDDAYDGGSPGSGSGRTIIADALAVQIVGAVAPTDPPPPNNPSGNLEVVGSVRLGSVGKPEINIDPNPFGGGPTVRMGHEIWPNDAPYGGNAWIMGNSTGLPQDHNYNLILGTMPAEQGTATGRVILMGGNAISDVDAGSVFIQGGTGQDGAGGVAGDIFLVPGESAAGSAGQVLLVDQSTGTGATLTAAGNFVGPMTAGSSVTFGTSAGAVVVTFAGGEDLAATRALFDATGVVTAAGDPIVLTTVAKGPTAEVYFLMESGAGTDGLLGTFSGETMTAGTWPSQIGIVASDANEISFGPSGPAGPLVYNAVTGKMTVPGVIDPTGMIFSESTLANIVLPANGWTGTDVGGLFVSDGTAGLLDNHLYYVLADGVTTVDLTGGGTGTVVGPGLSTDDALARWDGTTGTIIQNSTATLTDAGHLSVPTLQVTTGTGTAGNVLTDDGFGNASWAAPTGGAGDVVGPVGATDKALARFDLATGKLLQDSVGILTDAGDLSGLTKVTATNLQVVTAVAPTVGRPLIAADGVGNVSWANAPYGDVVGPVSSVDDAVARFDSTSGKLLQNSTATLTDAGVLTATDVTATAGLVGATLQVTTGAVLNHVLTSDVSGNATWVAPAGGASGTHSSAFAFVGAGTTTTTTITGLNVGDIVVQIWIRYTTTFLDATSTVECLESGGGSPIVSTAMTLPTSNQPGAWVFDPVYVAAGGPHDLQVKVISGAGETQGEGVVIALIHRA
jgi:hypothetical protein